MNNECILREMKEETKGKQGGTFRIQYRYNTWGRRGERIEDATGRVLSSSKVLRVSGQLGALDTPKCGSWNCQSPVIPAGSDLNSVFSPVHPFHCTDPMLNASSRNSSTCQYRDVLGEPIQFLTNMHISTYV